MTPDQIEIAARKLCELRGNDPDREAVAPRGQVGFKPMWTMYEADIRRVYLAQKAINYALSTERQNDEL